MGAGFPASYDGADQADLFAATKRDRRPVVRCWLAFGLDRDGVEAGLSFTERRQLIVDAATGRRVVGEDDLILIGDGIGEDLICLGPSWIAPALPANFRSKGLGLWSKRLRDMTLFRRPPDILPCIALEIRPGRPTGWAMIGAASAERIGAERIEAERTAARDDLNLLDGLAHFELGRTLATSARARAGRLERARWHLRQAARQFVASKALAWSEVAERHLGVLDRALFLAKQLDIPDLLAPEPDLQEAQLRSLGLGVRRLSLLPLPPLPLVPTASHAEDARSPDGHRLALCLVPLHRPTLRRLLPPVAEGMLRARIALGGVPLRAEPTAARLGLGQSVNISALLDAEVNHALRVASRGRGADRVTVFADGAGISLRPGIRQGRVGHPVTFRATARACGKHSIRFTFLTSGRIISKVQRTVEVIAE